LARWNKKFVVQSRAFTAQLGGLPETAGAAFAA
jgi:hypothetical protein